LNQFVCIVHSFDVVLLFLVKFEGNKVHWNCVWCGLCTWKKGRWCGFSISVVHWRCFVRRFRWCIDEVSVRLVLTTLTSLFRVLLHLCHSHFTSVNFTESVYILNLIGSSMFLLDMETDESSRVLPFQFQFDKPLASQIFSV